MIYVKWGFVIANAKYEWEPKIVKTWVGHIINSENFKRLCLRKKF